ncbi:RNA recognition motif domain and Nucleotide-binding, alpha-beta plait domain-containing protein [Aphelenchoides besseyi]|nr:RNA recognition motif domain and Nucleotide-binding, alpha-beta plait domain-containing protein [Aphelenchoides besseyi]
MPRQPKRMSRSPSPAVRESRRSRSPEARKSHRRSRTYSQSRSRSRSPAQCKRLHIANIDDSVRRRDIEDCYGKFGKLSDIWVASYPPFYAFVVYEHSDDAAKALEKMRSGYVRDCKVKTSIALPRNQNGGGRRFNGGGRFGSGSGGRHDRYDDRRNGDRGRGRSRSRSPRDRRSNRRSASPPARSSRRRRDSDDSR